MKTSQNNLNDQGKFSSKNDRYNFTGFSRDQFYIPTETNIINQGQRRIASTSYRKNKFSQEQTGFPRVYTSGCPHNTANLYLNKKIFLSRKNRLIKVINITIKKNCIKIWSNYKYL